MCARVPGLSYAHDVSVPRGWNWRLVVSGATATLCDETGPVHLSERASIVLAYLAVAGPTRRSRLAANLWPDADAERARSNLRQLLFRLRALGGDVIVGADPLQLGPGVLVEAATQSRTDTPSDVNAGVLEGLDPDAFGEFAAFFAEERARRTATSTAAAMAEWERAVGRGDWGDALHAAWRAMAADPVSERPYRLAMTAHLRLGAPGDALAEYRRCREVLERVIGVGPSQATSSLARQAAAAVAAASRAEGGLAAAGLGRRAEAGGWLQEGAAVLAAALETEPDAGSGARLAVELGWLELRLGRAQRAASAARRAVATDGVESSVLAEAWFLLGTLARYRGDLEEAESWWRQALAAAGRARAPVSEARMRLNVAQVEDALGATARAAEAYGEALRSARAAHDREVEVVVLNNLGHAALSLGLRSGDVRAPGGASASRLARELLAAALSIAKTLADRTLLASVLDGLGRAEVACGEPELGRSSAARAHLIASEVGDAVLRVETLATLAEASLALGDVSSARSYALSAERLVSDLKVAGELGERPRSVLYALGNAAVTPLGATSRLEEVDDGESAAL